MYSFLAVFLGSGLGGVSRWALSRWLNGDHPWGTLAANIGGCLLIGLVNGWLGRLAHVNELWRLLLAVGFCGGFTTFSTLANESFLLLRGHQLPWAIGYMVLSLTAGLLAVWCGYQISK